MISYRKTKTLSERIYESNKILTKYPSSIPVIIETEDFTIKNQIKKHKFLVPQYVSASNLLFSIRKQLELPSNKSIFMYCDDNLICGTEMMDVIYQRYLKNIKNGDKFLYIMVSTENSFG
jgi:hypothetical protein